MEHDLELFTIYDHPSDFPNSFVARRSIIRGGSIVPDRLPFLIGQDLDVIRKVLAVRGLYRQNRQESDDPVIVEVWL